MNLELHELTYEKMDKIFGREGSFRELMAEILSLFDWKGIKESFTFKFQELKDSLTGENVLGLCGSDRVLYFNPELLFENIYSFTRTLIHEMTHLNQFVTGRLKPPCPGKKGTVFLWKDKPNELTASNYETRPWEVEARIYERQAGRILDKLKLDKVLA